MKRRTKKTIRPHVVIILTMMLVAATSTVHFNAPSTANVISVNPQETMGICRCTDLHDLFNRLAEVEAAIATLQQEIEMVRGAHAGEDKWVQGYDSSKDQHLFEGDLQKAMDAAHDPLIKERVKNMTFPLDCVSSVQGYSTCLHKAAQAGEAVYLQYCQKRHGTNSDIAGLATGRDWQERTALTNLLDVARASYEAERKFINDEIARLKPYCPTKGWTGKVLISYSVKYNDTIPLPGTAIVGTKTIDQADLRDATIMVNDDRAYAELSVGITDKQITKGSGQTQCGKYKKGPVTVDKTETIEKHGDFYSRPTFKISFDGRGGLIIEGFVKGGYGVGTTNYVDNSQSPCETPSVSPKPGFLPKEFLDGVQFVAHGRGNPSALTLDGSDLPPNQQSIMGHQIKLLKVEWHLKRART